MDRCDWIALTGIVIGLIVGVPSFIYARRAAMVV